MALVSNFLEDPRSPNRQVEAADAVKQSPSGRWHIRIGFAGFNSKANNRSGYESQDAAIRAIERFEAKIARVG